MKPLEKSKLIEKFWDGDTTLNEEELLLNNEQQNISESKEAAYCSYISESRINPFNSQDEIWEAIKRNEKKKRSLLYWSTGIAASFLLLFSFLTTLFTVSRDESFGKQVTSNELKSYYASFGTGDGYDPTLYINGCKSSSDYHLILQSIHPRCIQKINMINKPAKSGKNNNENYIIDVWLKGETEELFSVCEGTLFFYQDGEIKSIPIGDVCSPNLLVDCRELPLSEIAQMQPNEIRSIEFTTDPRNCNGQLDGDFIVLESK
jgi:hypothetical protein